MASIAETHGLIEELLAVGNYMATVARKRGDYARARILYEQQHMRSEPLRDTNPTAGLASYRNHGAMEFELGNYESARKYYSKAWEIASQVGDTSKLAGLRFKYAQLERELGNLDTAYEYAIEAERVFSQLNGFRDVHRVRVFLSNLEDEMQIKNCEMGEQTREKL